MSAKVVTANRLTDGVVVYLDGRGGWSERVEEARVAQGEDAEALLVAVEAPDHAVQIAGPYLMDVAVDDGLPRALSNREIIRAKGPTVRTDLGKQAEPAL